VRVYQKSRFKSRFDEFYDVKRFTTLGYITTVTGTKKLPTVTVLIVNWNSGGLLTQCLKHLIEQTIQPAQVQVIDNASSDTSIDTVDSFENVSLEKLDTNLGFAAGNNLALAQCDSEFIALLNPDAFPEPEWLEKLLAAASSNPDVVAFGSRQLDQSKPEYLDGIGDNYHISGLMWRERHGVQQLPSDLIQREIFSPCAAAALYRRQAVVDVGGFDEDFFCYVEDVDLGFRLRLVGHKAMYVPDAIVHHVGSATTGGQHSDFAVYHGHRNLVWAYIKNMPGILFWVLLPLHLMMNLSVIILYGFRGQTGVILKAKWDAIKGIPWAWRKRKEIQANRIAAIGDIWSALNKGLIPLQSATKTKLHTEQHK
jgi:GT2 family glycosyltransferase